MTAEPPSDCMAALLAIPAHMCNHADTADWLKEVALEMVGTAGTA